MEIIVIKHLADELKAQFGCEDQQASTLVEGLFSQIVEHLRAGATIALDSFATLAAGNGAGQVTADQLAASLAEKVQVEKDQAAKMLSTMIETIKAKLLEGHEVQIRDFATFRVDEKKAKIIKDARTGQKMISPAKKVLGFYAEQKLEADLDGKAISFIPDQALSDKIAKLKVASILLVVPERDFFVETIEYHFNRAGWTVRTAVSIEQAREMLSGSETYLTILDSGMKDSQQLCELIKCRKETSLIPLILMYPKGTDIKRVDSFQVCGDEQVIQPFEVKNLLTLAETELARSSEEEAIFKQEVTFRLPTVDESIDKANMMGAKLFEYSGLSEEGQVALCAAFREALGNAAQHGNKHRRDKPLEILYLLDNEKITLAVTDAGNGFDHTKYVNQGKEGDALAQARKSHRAGKLGGLGIMLMLKCVDKLEYNEKGNVITLTKNLK